MLAQGSKIGHINNVRDWTTADPVIRQQHQQKEIDHLNQWGFTGSALNLQHYFNKTTELKSALQNLDGLWVSGGNAFVLRQAMFLSGFDTLFPALQQRKGFLYGGYSAAICVLCDSLKYIQHVDDPTNLPYPGIAEAIWTGLGVFNYGLLPHYHSPHYESEAIGNEVQHCIENKWLFKALRDGEVILLNEQQK